MNWDRMMLTLKREEGFNAKPYWDNDQWTYGYGCQAPSEFDLISEPDACALLAKELKEAYDYYKIMFRKAPGINEAREEALVDMMFNLGPSKLRKFRRMIEHLLDNDLDDWSDVAHEAMDSLWARQVKGRAVRIAHQLETGIVQEVR